MPIRRLMLLAFAVCAVSGCFMVQPAVQGCYQSLPAAELASTKPLTRFLVIGDFGTSEGARNAEVAESMRRYLLNNPPPPERVFELGDNFYGRGLTGSHDDCDSAGDPERLAAQALEVVQPWEFLRDADVPLTAVPGNHDYGCGGVGLTNQIELDRWLPAARRWGSHWQVVEGLPRELVLGGGAVQVLVLDSERMINEGEFREQSAKILELLLRRGKDRFRWRVVAGHHPPRTHGSHHGATWGAALLSVSSVLLFPVHLLAAWDVPPFTALNQKLYSIRYSQYRAAVERAVSRSGVSVALFMAGHDHQLQLLRPQRAQEPHVLVSGSAALCSPVLAGSDTVFAAPKYGFADIHVHADALDIDFVATSGCEHTQPCAVSDEWPPRRLFRYRIDR